VISNIARLADSLSALLHLFPCPCTCINSLDGWLPAMSPSPVSFLLPRGTGLIYGALFHNLCYTLLLGGNQTCANSEMVDLWARWPPISHALSRTFTPLCELAMNKTPHTESNLSNQDVPSMLHFFYTFHHTLVHFGYTFYYTFGIVFTTLWVHFGCTFYCAFWTLFTTLLVHFWYTLGAHFTMLLVYFHYTCDTLFDTC
jgi:hypothetical protein